MYVFNFACSCSIIRWCLNELVIDVFHATYLFACSVFSISFTQDNMYVSNASLSYCFVVVIEHIIADHRITRSRNQETDPNVYHLWPKPLSRLSHCPVGDKRSCRISKWCALSGCLRPDSMFTSVCFSKLTPFCKGIADDATCFYGDLCHRKPCCCCCCCCSCSCSCYVFAPSVVTRQAPFLSRWNRIVSQAINVTASYASYLFS